MEGSDKTGYQIQQGRAESSAWCFISVQDISVAWPKEALGKERENEKSDIYSVQIIRPFSKLDDAFQSSETTLSE